jgi:lysozyme
MPEVLLELIRRFEGLRLKAYLCPAGVPTIGYGSTGPDVKLGMTWPIEKAEARMAQDAAVHVAAARRYCPALEGAALGAIADFSYNLGATRLKSSTLRRKLNAGDMEGAKVELARWVRGGGRILPGLVIRRAAEAALL